MRSAARAELPAPIQHSIHRTPFVHTIARHLNRSCRLAILVDLAYRGDRPRRARFEQQQYRPGRVWMLVRLAATRGIKIAVRRTAISDCLVLALRRGLEPLSSSRLLNRFTNRYKELRPPAGLRG